MQPLAAEWTPIWTQSYKIVCGPGSCTIYYSRSKTAAMHHAWKTGGSIAIQSLREACGSLKGASFDLSGLCKGAIRAMMANMAAALADANRQHACFAAKAAFSVFAQPSKAFSYNGKHCFGKAPVKQPPPSRSCVYNWTRILRFGTKGADVAELQRRLNAQGAKLRVDGKFGEKTRVAVAAFQRSHHLGVDGVVGPKTQAVLNKVCPKA